MNKIDNVRSDLGEALRTLRDDELESVTGGFIVDWSTRDFVSITEAGLLNYGRTERGFIIDWKSY